MKLLNSTSKRWQVGLLAISCMMTGHGYAANGPQSSTPKIVGGTPVEPGKYPWMAALLDANSGNQAAQFCGGSLIRPNWVLTAAHCVEGSSANSVDILVGREDLNDEGGERIGVAEIIVHPDFSGRGSPDLALLKLKSASTQATLELEPFGSDLGSPGTLATVTGWGVISEDGPTSSILLETMVPIVPHSVCSQAYGGGIIEDDMICAGLSTGGKDSCFGDSGGPLFVAGPQGEKFRQAGVVSFGEGCARPELPGVYARVSTYQPWIVETIGEDPINPPDPEGPLTADFTFICDGLNCEFDGSRSTSDAPVDFYIWDFGDGMYDFGIQATRTYEGEGEFTVTLFVLTNDGRIAQKSTVVQVSSSITGPDADVFTGNLSGNNDSDFVPENGEGFTITQNAILNGRLEGPAGSDFDLYLLKFNDELNDFETIAYSVNLDSNEEINFEATPGRYTWLVYSFEGSGDYSLTTSLPQ